MKIYVFRRTFSKPARIGCLSSLIFLKWTRDGHRPARDCALEVRRFSLIYKLRTMVSPGFPFNVCSINRWMDRQGLLGSPCSSERNVRLTMAKYRFIFSMNPTKELSYTPHVRQQRLYEFDNSSIGYSYIYMKPLQFQTKECDAILARIFFNLFSKKRILEICNTNFVLCFSFVSFSVHQTGNWVKFV